jgi:hypothetical protein
VDQAPSSGKSEGRIHAKPPSSQLRSPCCPYVTRRCSVQRILEELDGCTQAQIEHNSRHSAQIPRPARSRNKVRFPAPPLNSRLKMASAAILLFHVPRMCRELAAAGGRRIWLRPCLDGCHAACIAGEIEGPRPHAARQPPVFCARAYDGSLANRAGLAPYGRPRC